ncbi:MAG: hypothetical protein H8E34_10250 [Bacteroidetes bacterium]|nr:hypothetical protein [Bacteroidota bacterium]MBL6944566.1 hypothetical protein [Bacteroidales bacterium]
MNKNIDINLSNYETFVIDYLDGKLNAIATACFITFLENNPDIKEEIVGLKDIMLNPDESSFADKNKLKRKPVISVGDINEDNYEEFFIASYESDLNESQKKLLLQFLDKNPNLNKEFNLHSHLHLAPSFDIVFSDKELLKHKSKLVPIWYSSAAAIIILFAGYWFIFNQQSPNFREEFMAINKIAPKTITTSLSSATVKQYETEERQISIIQLSENDFSNIVHEEIRVAYLESKSINGQLVDANDFTPLAQLQNSGSSSINRFENSKHEIVPTTINTNKSLIASVFKNQYGKLLSNLGLKRPKGNKSSDPTYIKVLDKGILVFNTVTGSETSTIKTYNRNGDLTSYQIEGQEVLLSRNFGGGSSQ